MRRFFVTGTDTEVGKTYVTTALIAAAHSRGTSVAGFKPAESGVEGEPADASALWHAMGQEGLVPRSHCRYRYRPAVAPGVAADAAGERMDFEQIEADIQGSDAELVFIEGAGGLHVPMGGGRLLSELMIQLGAPALVVARADLGTINHSLLTLRELANLGIESPGVVLNGATDFEFAESNRREIEDHGGRVLGIWPHAENVRAEADALLDVLLG